MQLIIMPRARRQLDAALKWWLDHRDKAPHAFSEDTARGFTTITEQPTLGERVPGRSGVRRYFLRRIGYFIYYRVVNEQIEVVAVWHHARGSGPPL